MHVVERSDNNPWHQTNRFSEDNKSMLLMCSAGYHLNNKAQIHNYCKIKLTASGVPSKSGK